MPLFDRGFGRQSSGRAWLITAGLHVVAIILAVTVPWQAPRRKAEYIVLQPLESGDSVVFVPGTRELRAKGPTIQSTRRPALPPPTPAPPIATVNPPVDTSPTMPAYDPNAAKLVPPPQVGDGRLWVSPRPGLPAAVADAIYGDTTGRAVAAIDRLRVMVDSLNQVLDQIQRENKRPSWTIGGTPGKPEWGIDSAYIHVAGIKIPTAALALLGNLLPQGNFDESMRARQLQYMREDLMQAAARAQTFQQFRRYVRELRERKQAERDAEERRRAQDTVSAVP
ncbi:MAG: hypothetical protein ABR537_02055 [Gemmatimonadales bacterium]